MSMLPFRVLHASQVSVLPAVARAISVIGLVFDVFAEADEQARIAHKRYPFIKG